MTQRIWSQEAPMLESVYGIHLYGAQAYQGEGGALAMDSVPNYTPGTPVTVSNDGVMVQFLNYIDPKIIDIAVAPNRAAEIFGEGKVSDWTQIYATFILAEQTGQPAAYGDFSKDGTSGVNFNYEQRQQFLVQAFMEAGDLEIERAGAGRIDLVNRKRIAQVRTLDQWQNRAYFFGVSGLLNYGVLTDPALTAANVPTTGAAGTTWANKTALEIYADFLAAYQRILTASNGLLSVNVDTNIEIVFCLPNTVQAYLGKKNEFGLSVRGLVKETFPNARIESAPQFATASGNILYAFIPGAEGEETIDLAFSEKLRSHRLILDDSSMRQKMTSGSWGAIIKQPFLIDQTIGI